jgi:NDP-sugar pyrophosphorylase family protein
MSLRIRPDETAGVVLVGTHPWRDATFDRLPARPLLPIGHRPLIAYALGWLRDGGVSTAAVCGNRETKTLESRLHRHVPLGLDVTYLEDPMPRGAAGAVRDAALASDADVFVVADGTAIPNVNLRSLLETHSSNGAVLTIVMHSEPGGHGKPPLHVPSGIYVFNRSALEAVPVSGFYDIKENLIPHLHRKNERVCAFAADGPPPRVLDESSYRAVNEWMVEHLVAQRSVPEGYILAGSSLIHRDAIVARDVTFVGPVLIAAGAEISPGAVLVGPTSIGCDASVGAGAVVSRTAVWRRCVLGENVVTDRCILADDTVIAPGTQVFREVLVTATRCFVQTAREGARPLREPLAVDLWRRMGRAVLSNASWSRFPASQ